MPDDVKRPLKVFLCHASADKPKVRELYRYLKRRGLQPWLDAEDLLPGQAWQVEIPQAIETSDAIIICLSKGSVDKEGYVQKEIKFALDKALEMPEGRIFLIPARLEECDVPRSLSAYHWVDLFDEGGHEKLMKSLKLRAEQLQRSAVQTPKPTEMQSELHSKTESEQSKNISVHVDGNVQGNIINGNENAVWPEPETPIETEPPAISDEKKPPRKLKTEYIVAIITAAATIIAGIFSSTWIEKWLTPAPMPTSLAIMSILTISPTSTFTTFSPSETPELGLTTLEAPTYTPTSLPTEITIRPTETPSWSNIISVRMPTLNEIRQNMLSIWDANGLSMGDMSAPELRSFSGTVKSSQEYLWPIYWCAIDKATLDENIKNISTSFTVNGEQVPEQHIFDYNYDTNTGWKCNYRAIVLGGWHKGNQITLKVTRVLKSKISDGQATYATGEYAYELNILVK